MLAWPGLAWVVTAYTVVLGALPVPVGRLADLLGPRRALVTGLAIFVAASVTCATAWTPTALIAARAVAGAWGRGTAGPGAPRGHVGGLTASAQIGTALGMAAITPLAASAGPAGYRTDFVGAAVVTLVGVVAALHLPAAQRRATGDRDVRRPLTRVASDASMRSRARTSMRPRARP
jgi:MFS family permease